MFSPSNDCVNQTSFVLSISAFKTKSRWKKYYGTLIEMHAKNNQFAFIYMVIQVGPVFISGTFRIARPVK